MPDVLPAAAAETVAVDRSGAAGPGEVRSVTADAVAPPPRHPRFPLIDGMRAIAVFSVLGVHVAVAGNAVSSGLVGRLLAHLNIGVTIFFLISGFLLYRPMVAHRNGGAAAPRTGDYAKRRFLRIYPAYWVILTVLVLAPGLTGVIDGHWWPMYALLHTLPVYHGRGCIEVPSKCGLAQTWSLVVELTFYVVLPVYAFLIARLTRRLSVRGWMLVELAVLSALSALSVTLQFAVLDPVPRWLGSSVCGYVFWFALGMGMAVISVGLGDRGGQPQVKRRGIPPAALWLSAFVVYLLVSLWLPSSPFLFLRSQQLVAYLSFGVISALLLAPAVFRDHAGGLPRRLLRLPVVAWLGLISYGIFLWHYVVTLELGPHGANLSLALMAIGVTVISIACAAASYYLVERPLLRLKYHRLRDVLGRPGGDRLRADRGAV